jgi:hypothetical protein
MVDTSNHKNLKLVPVLIQYFTPEKRVQTKVTEFNNLKAEMADVLMTYIMNTLHKYKLSDKIFAFCWDNCNINFGGAQGEQQCFCQARCQQFKNEHSEYGLYCPYFA